jgi:hypothetical protein
VIRTKFVYTRKSDQTAKARWVAQEVRHKGTPALYSPVANDDSLKVFLAAAVSADMEVDVVDINQAFLMADIYGDVYVTQPEGFVVTGKENFVYKLRKSLYGLQRAPKLWNEELNNYLVSLGVEVSEADPCLYSRVVDGIKMLILLHVDDLAIASSSRTALDKLKSQLHEKYGIKDLGPMKRYLSYQVLQESSNKDHDSPST